MGREAREKAERRSERRRIALIKATDAGRRLTRAGEHIDTLDESVQAWLAKGSFALVDRPDPETGHHVLYASVSEPIDSAWALLAGEGIHGLRSALDMLAYDMLRAAHGGEVPPALEHKSAFPIVGVLANSGAPHKDPEAEFLRAVKQKLAGISKEAIGQLRELQPYMSPAPKSHELQLIDELDRVQKHRRLTLTSAAAQLSEFAMGGTGYFPYFWAGGGTVVDGTRVAEWADPQGPAPALRVRFERTIALGDGEPAAGRPLVETLRSLQTFTSQLLSGPLVEPPRVVARFHHLRGWDHGKKIAVSAGGP